MVNVMREIVFKWMKRNDEKCMELQRLISELKSRGFNLGNLYVDENDYPRSDIDNIVRRIRCLQTEIRDVGEKMCEEWIDMHNKRIARLICEMSPFAVVDEVLPNSTGEVMHNMKIVLERDGELLDIYFNGNGADVDNGLGLTLRLVERFPLITMESP
ncbi:conserved hypothetical protein [Trichinella spiralis]|uniref:hypothetical protein n=1 Tax=Trichinella spiralis TaxID=6334 RepID=UPI0001EFBE9A|nr:conserved hypothetical protein [Trichinella spiralis]